MSLLVVDRLSKVYKNGFYANKDISFTVKKGEVFGILGPNGAGKTTLIKQITGLIKPTNGMIEMEGVDILKNIKFMKENCALQPQNHIPMDGLTPYQLLNIIGKIKRGGSDSQIKERVRYLLRMLQIEEWENCPSQRLSGGVRRLVSFAAALIVLPKLLILDEPTNDVDPSRRRLLWNMVKDTANSNTSILLITHNVMEAEKIVDRIAIMNQSKIIKSGKLSELKGSDDGRLALDVWTEEILDYPEYFDVQTIDRVLNRIFIKKEKVPEALDWVMDKKHKGSIEQFNMGPITLEDVYLKYINNER